MKLKIQLTLHIVTFVVLLRIHIVFLFAFSEETQGADTKMNDINPKSNPIV